MCLHNLTGSHLTAEIASTEVSSATDWTPLLAEGSDALGSHRRIRVPLRPYQVNWLTARPPGGRS
jgi:hypothetical protein